MSEPRRLIDSAPPGSAYHTLLEAGRASGPSAAAKQQLLDAALPLFAAGAGAGAGAAMSKLAAGKVTAGKVTAGKLGGTLAAAKWGAVLLIGAGAAGLWLEARSRHNPSSVVEPGEKPGVVRSPAEREEAVVAEAPTPSKPTEAVAARSGALQPSRPATQSVGRPAARTKRSPRSKVERAGAKTPVETTSAAPAAAATPPTLTDPSVSAQVTPAAPEAAAVIASREAPPSQRTPFETGLKEELRELDAVRAALRRGDRDAAERLLTSYFVSHPRGYLAPEARRLQQRIAASAKK